MEVVTDPPGYACLRRVNPAGATDHVYLARRLTDGSEVVVRVFDRTLTASRDRERFEEEAARLAALADVQYVLPLLDAGVAPGGHAYVVMPYCVAGSLQDHAASMGRLSPAEVRRVGVKLATALGEVHQCGIVHRNITPSNVLIDASGEPALADFGIVALNVSGDFRLEPWRGYVPFVAPEAYLPELMTAAADIYALGATLYALLAGTGPLGGPPRAVADHR